MEVIEIIKQRKSIRHFRPEPPSRELLQECLEAATWAPNPTTQQPWKFIVLSGDALAHVAGVIENHFSSAQKRTGHEPVPTLREETRMLLEERKNQTFQHMLSFLKEKGVDMQEVGRGNFCFHHAPVGIIFATYPAKDLNYYKSTVAAMENFIIAATAKGLGTCWMNAVSLCQEYIKESLHLPQELIFIDGVAVGYPVDDSPLNQIPRTRLPVNEFTLWL